MDKIEQLKAGIEETINRPEDTDTGNASERDASYCEGRRDGKRDVLKNLLIFIDSLVEEPASGDLEDAAEKYAWSHDTVGCTIGNKHYRIPCADAIKTAVMYGAAWQKSRMMKGLCFETKVYLEDDGCAEDYNYTEWLALENTEISEFPEKELGLKPGDTVQVIMVKEDKENEIL